MSKHLLFFLQGNWSVNKQFILLPSHAKSSMQGSAQGTLKSTHTVLFQESLEGSCGSYTGRSSSFLSYNFVEKTPQVWKRGELFHTLHHSLPFTMIRHICGKDFYFGLYVFDFEKNSFSICWKVKGPSKNYLLQSHYKKISEPQPLP